MLPYVYIPRPMWGSAPVVEEWIARRVTDPAASKDTLIGHHTGAIDVGDNTPNRWTLDRAAAYMKRLQTARPDLGPLPYSFNCAVSEDLKTVWFFEGRGALPRGAHTAQLNQRGIGEGILGNFDREDVDAAYRIITAMEFFNRDLRDGKIPGHPALPNLATNLSPKGWEIWGHRDGPGVSKTCPGNTIYPKFAAFTMAEPIPEPEEEDMQLYEQWVRALAVRHPVEGHRNAGKQRLAELNQAKLIGNPIGFWQDLLDEVPEGDEGTVDPIWRQAWVAVETQRDVNLARIAGG